MNTRKPNKQPELLLPPPTANDGNEFPPFLRAKDIAAKGITEITLLGNVRKSSSQFAEGIDVDCKIDDKKYTWTIKYNSGNYSRLYMRFKTGKWEGVVQVERKIHMGNEYVAVVD